VVIQPVTCEAALKTNLYTHKYIFIYTCMRSCLGMKKGWDVVSLDLRRYLLLIMGSVSEAHGAYRPLDMELCANSTDHGHQLRHNLCLLCEFAQRQKIFNSVLYIAVSTNIAQL
jgi:hypothetical protein